MQYVHHDIKRKGRLLFFIHGDYPWDIEDFVNRKFARGQARENQVTVTMIFFTHPEGMAGNSGNLYTMVIELRHIFF